jgi:hypothetical protein
MKKINFFITLLFTALILSAPTYTQNQTQEVGLTTTVADSLTKDSVLQLVDVPPCSWQEGVKLGTRGEVIYDADYHDFYASSLDNYNEFPRVGYVGNGRNYDDGVMTYMRDKETDKYVWVYDPIKNKKKYKLRKYSRNRTFEVWILLDSETGNCLPGIGVKDGTIKAEEMVDNKLPGKQRSWNYPLRPQKIDMSRYEEVK